MRVMLVGWFVRWCVSSVVLLVCWCVCLDDWVNMIVWCCDGLRIVVVVMKFECVCILCVCCLCCLIVLECGMVEIIGGVYEGRVICLDLICLSVCWVVVVSVGSICCVFRLFVEYVCWWLMIC